MLWPPGSVWKVFKLVRANFEQFGAGPVSWSVLTAPGGQLRCRRSNRPGLGEQIFALCCIPVLHCCIGSGGVTPDFPKETKCIPIGMPGSRFMHIVTYK
jgi:hypothetical protein